MTAIVVTAALGLYGLLVWLERVQARDAERDAEHEELDSIAPRLRELAGERQHEYGREHELLVWNRKHEDQDGQ